MNHRKSVLALGLGGLTAILSVLATAVLWLSPAWAADAGVPSMVDPTALRWGLMAAAGATAASSLGAGYAVAVVGSAAVGALAEKPEILGRVLILVGLAEGIAIYGVLISVLILNRVA